MIGQWRVERAGGRLRDRVHGIEYLLVGLPLLVLLVLLDEGVEPLTLHPQVLLALQVRVAEVGTQDVAGIAVPGGGDGVWRREELL